MKGFLGIIVVCNVSVKDSRQNLTIASWTWFLIQLKDY